MAFGIIILVIAIAQTVYLMKKGINIGIIMLINAVLATIGTKMEFGAIIKTFALGIISEKTISIIVILVLIMVVENIMRESGEMTRMVDNLKYVVGSNRVTAMLLPVTLGLLPSPGGARFSCPMVDEVIGEHPNKEDKAFINYWFRHLWVDGFILYPALILAAEMVGESVLTLFVHLTPFMVLYGLLGYFFYVRKIEYKKLKSDGRRRDHAKKALAAGLPIILIVALYMILMNFTRFALHTSLVTVIIYLAVYNKYKLKQVWLAFKNSFKWKYVILIGGVMVFTQVLNNSGLMDSIITGIDKYNIPVKLLYMLLPAAAALISGITVSTISLAFPLLLPLGLGDNMWLYMSVYAFGFSVMMITPLHLCSVMSADYFGANIKGVLARSSKVAIAAMIVAAIVILLI